MNGEKAEIIHSVALLTCGTELLMGQIVNTNASWLAAQLRDIGITSRVQLVVGDNPERLEHAITALLERNDCIILTGGLGPTEDDISMACVAHVLGVELVPNEEAKKSIEGYFVHRKIPMPKNNEKQALLPPPEAGLIIPNPNGTAPGAIFRVEREGRLHHVVLLPGPPLENRPMFDLTVRPYLEERRPTQLRNVFLHILGMGESQVVQEIADLIANQTNPTIAPYCSTGEVTLRLTQSCAGAEDPDLLTPVVEEIRSRLGRHIYSEGSKTLPEVLMEELKKQKLTVAFAESCTAGLATALLADCPGISEVLLGGIVAYTEEAKQRLLGVSPELLKRQGAVSAACARSMALGVREALDADIGLSVTGYAGPSGGSEKDPLGTVFLAVADRRGEQVEHHQLKGNREKIRRTASVLLLGLLYRKLGLFDSEEREEKLPS